MGECEKRVTREMDWRGNVENLHGQDRFAHKCVRRVVLVERFPVDGSIRESAVLPENIRNRIIRFHFLTENFRPEREVVGRKYYRQYRDEFSEHGVP